MQADIWLPFFAITALPGNGHSLPNSQGWRGQFSMSSMPRDAPALSVEALRKIPSQQWPELKLRAHPAVEIVHGEWRVADVLSAVESGHDWSEPGHESAAMIVWRQDAQVHYRDLQEVEARALGLVSEGATFAAICEAIAARPRAARSDNSDRPNAGTMVGRRNHISGYWRIYYLVS